MNGVLILGLTSRTQLGGVAIGVTGGLAAPLLVPLVPFLGLSAAAAPVVLGSLFGLAGGGLTGYRVRRRWAGVDHFEFVDLSSEMQDDKEKAVRAPSMTATILVPGLQVRVTLTVYSVLTPAGSF